jgi:hypothetical protein
MIIKTSTTANMPSVCSSYACVLWYRFM